MLGVGEIPLDPEFPSYPDTEFPSHPVLQEILDLCPLIISYNKTRGLESQTPS